jgi:PAS domain S-box-containing protein
MNKTSFIDKNVFPCEAHDELDLLRTIVEKIPAPISISSTKTYHMYHNQAFSDLFGYNIDEFRKKSLESLFTAPDEIKKAIVDVIDGRVWKDEVSIITETGRIVPVMVQLSPIMDNNGRSVFFSMMLTDLSEQKKLEKKFRYQNEYLSTLHSISLGMFRRLNLSDLLNAIILRACRLTGIPNGFLHLYDMEKNLLEIKAACGNLSDAVGTRVKPGKGLAGKVFETGEPILVDNYKLWPDNLKEASFRHIFAIVGIPLVSGSRIEGVIGLSHDREDMQISPEIIPVLEQFSAIAQIAIDNAKLFENQTREFEKRIALEKERKEMEIRLHQSQRMESIGTLAGGVAHDFNNILSAIMGFTQLAQARAENDSVLADDLNEIYRASLRAKDLVQQILTFARQSDEQAHPIKIGLIAKEVLKFIRSSIPSTIKIKQNIDTECRVLANPTQVYQVFLNLFTNASQAMDKGGVLKVDLESAVLEKSTGSLDAGDYVRTVVSDTGTGIKPENLSLIFEPYFTTRGTGEGTGLGLAVVHGVVKSLGGDIFVESILDRGTKFTFYLPLVKDTESGKQVPEDTCPVGSGEHVLFVDDEKSISKLGKRMLQGLNYRVTALNDSRMALEVFEKKPHDFDAVVTDMTMPDMTGDRLAGKLKEIRQDIPVILCTGYHHFMSDEGMKNKGIDAVCEKPILRSELACAVRRLLDRNL